jgi:hypothetical protein
MFAMLTVLCTGLFAAPPPWWHGCSGPEARSSSVGCCSAPFTLLVELAHLA